MANILNIDTSSAICSVALSVDGEIRFGLESSEKMDHSVSLAPFVKKCFEFLKENHLYLDAVSVANGPGSYTGLRIGLSLAKGIAFGCDIPLITLSTLEIMAVRAIFSYHEFEGMEWIIPMIDARRMEVYAGVYNSSLQKVENERPVILDETSFSELPSDKKLILIGDGTTKFRPLFNRPDTVWLGEKQAHAKYMVPLSEKYYREEKFADVAYSVPSYLKQYQATTPKKKL